MRENLQGRTIQLGSLRGRVIRVIRTAVDRQGKTVEYADTSVMARLDEGLPDGGTLLKEIPIESIRETPTGELVSHYAYSANGTKVTRKR